MDDCSTNANYSIRRKSEMAVEPDIFFSEAAFIHGAKGQGTIYSVDKGSRNLWTDSEKGELGSNMLSDA